LAIERDGRLESLPHESHVRLHSLTYLDDGRQRFMEGGEVDHIRRDRIDGNDSGGRCALAVLLDFWVKRPALGPDGWQLSPEIPVGIESSEDAEDPLVQPNRRHGAPP
jgi:hypothetical protein